MQQKNQSIPQKTSSVKRNWQLYLMLLLPVAYFILFKYMPIFNARIAFVNYNMFQGMAGSQWNNFAHFKELFQQSQFLTALKNTLVLNLLDILFGFPAPILIALVLNELKSSRIKNFTQTIIYIPHFLSWVIIAGIVSQVFGSSGVLNTMRTLMGMAPVNVLGNTGSWMAVYVGTGVWQSAGYGTIIYLAALAGIDPSLYEAAYIDGASRLRRIWSITLPCISGTIVTMLILTCGNIVNVSFERPFVMSNSLVQSVSDVISTYVYRVGLEGGRFDYSAAVGLFQSVVSFVILVLVNHATKKMGEEGIM